MSLEAFQWNGKNALVTGSHRGLGALQSPWLGSLAQGSPSS
jgi:hypothetical protein